MSVLRAGVPSEADRPGDVLLARVCVRGEKVEAKAKARTGQELRTLRNGIPGATPRSTFLRQRGLRSQQGQAESPRLVSPQT